MVRFDRFDNFLGYFASGSGEMAPLNFLGAFRQSHWRNALTEPNRIDQFGLISVFKNI